MIKSASLVLLLISLVGLSHGLYFHIAETERKCFIEEIPDETTVIGKHSNCCDSSHNPHRLLFFQLTTKLSFMIHGQAASCLRHQE